MLIFTVNEILRRDLDKEVFYRALPQRSCHGDFFQSMESSSSLIEILYADLAKTPLIHTEFTELVQISLKQILLRDLSKGACTETLFRDLLRSCQEALT